MIGIPQVLFVMFVYLKLELLLYTHAIKLWKSFALRKCYKIKVAKLEFSWPTYEGMV